MSRLRLTYSETCRGLIKSLHYDLKPALKKEIDSLRTAPYLGKPLIEELAEFYFLRFRRYRVIYRIENEKRQVAIYYVGYRRDIYEEFRKFLSQEAEAR